MRRLAQERRDRVIATHVVVPVVRGSRLVAVNLDRKRVYVQDRRVEGPAAMSENVAPRRLDESFSQVFQVARIGQSLRQA